MAYSGKSVAEFVVLTPLPLPILKEPHGRLIAEERLDGHFWSTSGAAADVGCYIFAMRGGKGAITPWYIGKATVSFRQEVFTPDKLVRYYKVLAKGQGTPLMFLVRFCRKKKVNVKAIKSLETFLIGLGFEINSKLMNKRGRPIIPFSIKGVLPARPGEAKARAARQFRQMMSL